jgi:hypothetical protein
MAIRRRNGVDFVYVQSRLIIVPITSFPAIHSHTIRERAGSFKRSDCSRSFNYQCIDEEDQKDKMCHRRLQAYER